MITESEFPREIIMKVVYKNKPTLRDTIKSCLDENNIKNNSVADKASSSANYISFTVKGIFDSDETLNKVCTELKMIEGYMMMF